MAKGELKNIFLSASIPLPERDPKYFETADTIAIRDSVIALASVILPKYRLIWGGHPSITPIIYHVMEKLNLEIQEHVKLYQSLYFEKYFPKDNNKFENVEFIDKEDNKELSLLQMRTIMFSENNFVAGVFIGGMEGVEEEFSLFQTYHPNAAILPIASTGAAAQIIYNSLLNNGFNNTRLLIDYDFNSLFQNLFID